MRRAGTSILLLPALNVEFAYEFAGIRFGGESKNLFSHVQHLYARIENGFLQPLTIFSFVCLTFVWPIEIYTPSHHLLAVKHADTACMHQMHTLFVFVCPGNFKLYYLTQGDDETEEYRCTEWDRLYYTLISLFC